MKGVERGFPWWPCRLRLRLPAFRNVQVVRVLQISWDHLWGSAWRLILVSTGNLDWKWWEGLPFKNSNPRDFFCWIVFFCKNGWTIKWERNPWWIFEYSVDLPSSFKLPQGGGVYTPLQCLHSSWIHPHRFCSRHEPRSCAAPKLKRFSCEWLDAVGAMGTLGVM